MNTSLVTNYLYWRWRFLFAAGERQRYKSTLRKLPRLIESNKFDEIEMLLLSCGSFQAANNFRDLVNFFRSSRDKISKIVEIGAFNFASSTLINCLKRENTFFFGFDNWDLGGPKARAMAEWRVGFFPNSHVISGHPLPSSVQAKELENTDMLVIDGNHSFQSTVADCACFDFLKDGATVFFHDCGLGNRIWGCFWVFYLLQKYEIICPSDQRFASCLSNVDPRRKPAVNEGEKPGIEFAIGVLNQAQFLQFQELLQNTQLLWDEVRDRFNMRAGLDMTAQFYLWDEWFC